MKAMILAAGLGKRLHPISRGIPKILVPVLGVPMLERLAAWLGSRGVEALAINTHHHAEMVESHVNAMAEMRPGLPPIRLYREEFLLGTGGGVANIADFGREGPLLVWNGDILADLDPNAMLEAQLASGAEGTLAVQHRPSDSLLLADEQGNLCGIDSPRRGVTRRFRQPEGEMRSVAFQGVSLLSPALRAKIVRDAPFDLIDALLDAAADGARIKTFDMEEGFWGTTGSKERLAALETALRERLDLLEQYTPPLG